jgi:hypothetical protein
MVWLMQKILGRFAKEIYQACEPVKTLIDPVNILATLIATAARFCLFPKGFPTDNNRADQVKRYAQQYHQNQSRSTHYRPALPCDRANDGYFWPGPQPHLPDY